MWSTPIFITDPVVAAAYGVHPAEFATVADPLEGGLARRAAPRSTP